MDFATVIDAAFSAALGPQAIVFALAAIGLNIHFGYTGLLNFGQAGFMSIAAFGLAVSVVTWDLSFWLALVIALGASVLLALVLGEPTVPTIREILCRPNAPGDRDRAGGPTRSAWLRGAGPVSSAARP